MVWKHIHIRWLNVKSRSQFVGDQCVDICLRMTDQTKDEDEKQEKVWKYVTGNRHYTGSKGEQILWFSLGKKEILVKLGSQVPFKIVGNRRTNIGCFLGNLKLLFMSIIWKFKHIKVNSLIGPHFYFYFSVPLIKMLWNWLGNLRTFGYVLHIFRKLLSNDQVN